MLFNHILYINKPIGITSHDVCLKIKKILNIKAVGHTGTLDPNASGVMIVLLNKACKLNQFLVKQNKVYEGLVKVGFKTDSLDIDGKIIQKSDARIENFDLFKNSTSMMLGKQLQKPPLVSAVKVKGKKLLEYKLNNIDVNIPDRMIEIFNFEVFDVDKDSFKFKAEVSSGTYIRVLIEDFLNKFNLLGTLTTLTRKKVGFIDIDQCQNIDDLKDNCIAKTPYEIMSSIFKVVEVENPYQIMQGKIFNYDGQEDEILLVKNKQLLAVYQRVKHNEYKCVRGLF